MKKSELKLSVSEASDLHTLLLWGMATAFSRSDETGNDYYSKLTDVGFTILERLTKLEGAK